MSNSKRHRPVGLTSRRRAAVISILLPAVASCGTEPANTSAPTTSQEAIVMPTVAEPPSDSVLRGFVTWSRENASIDGTRVTIRFPGSRPFNPQDLCSTAYTAVVDEQADAVTVQIQERSPVPSPGEVFPDGCSAEGHERSVELDLAAPLGNRSLQPG